MGPVLASPALSEEYSRHTSQQLVTPDTTTPLQQLELQQILLVQASAGMDWVSTIYILNKNIYMFFNQNISIKMILIEKMKQMGGNAFQSSAGMDMYTPMPKAATSGSTRSPAFF
jgi:hypothetical protein